MSEFADYVEPAFSDNVEAIVFASNDSYAPYLGVMIQSIVENSHRDHFYDLVILTSDITEATKDKLLSITKDFENFSLRIIFVDGYFENIHLFTENNAYITNETYYRILIPELFSMYERVIYLDGDMICNVDIARLYTEPFEGASLISTRDYWGTAMCYQPENTLHEYRSELLRSSNVDDYFIAGLIIFNIPLLRDYTIELMLKICSQRDWQQHDQDVLNYLFCNKTKLMSAKWDYMSDIYDEMHYLPGYLYKQVVEAKSDPFIIHFGGARKPWRRAYVDYDVLFWGYASRSPFLNDILFSMKGKLGYKYYLIKRVFDSRPDIELLHNNVYFYYADTYIGKFNDVNVSLTSLAITQNGLLIEGFVPDYGISEEHDVKFYVRCGKSFYSSVPTTLYKEARRKDGELIWTALSFKFIIPLSDIHNTLYISLLCFVDDSYVYFRHFNTEKYCAVSANNLYSYQYSQGFILQPRGRQFLLREATDNDAAQCEELFLESFRDNPLYSQIVKLRQFALSEKPDNEIWLFSDRTNKADDNGEALFRYVNEHPELNVDSYYVLLDTSPDYERLSKIGNVVPCLSEEHLKLHLSCTYNFSSQADPGVLCPFEDNKAYRDLLQSQKYVFLQHGVLLTDVSRWCNRINLNPWAVITSAKAEERSMLDNPVYNFDRSIVKLTGLARHDRLINQSKKRITIMPTWRRWLFERHSEDLGVWQVVPGFENSRYFQAINDLITDERLRSCAREHGYEICFLPHPNVQGALPYFTKCSDVCFLGISASYNEVFASSDLVITDYSSSVLDFSYLRKPILYYQFDRDDFSSGMHTSAISYFDYEADGFGEIAYSHDDLIDLIIEYMESGCAIKAKYLNRINRFFAFNDHNACKRIVDAVTNKTKEAANHEDIRDLQISRTVSGITAKRARISTPITQSLVFNRCREQIGLDCEMPESRLIAFETQPLYWATSTTSACPVQIPIKLVHKNHLKGLYTPTIKDYEELSPKYAFMAQLGALLGGNSPYSAIVWDAPIDHAKVGCRWYPVSIGGRFRKYATGDIVSFKDGTVGLVCDIRDGKQIRFICPIEEGGSCLVFVGSLINKRPIYHHRSSMINDLPEVYWVLRKY